MDNFYEILGIPENADQDHIRKSFRALAKQHHPDMPAGDERRFRKIHRAYEVLSNPDARHDYDKTLRFHREGAGSFDAYTADVYELQGRQIENVLKELFRQGTLTRVKIKQKGRVLIDLPFSTAAAITALGFLFAPLATLLINVGIDRFFELEVSNKVMDLYEKAGAAHQGGNLAAAEKLYKDVIAMSEFFVPAHLNLGMLYRQRGENQQAIECFKHVLELTPFGQLGDMARANLESLRGF